MKAATFSLYALVLILSAGPTRVSAVAAEPRRASGVAASKAAATRLSQNAKPFKDSESSCGSGGRSCSTAEAIKHHTLVQKKTETRRAVLELVEDEDDL
mmetsp:Transcript_67684/g.122049  ORF Transcript_67684/g.122049 Transcript_67684/m.122049 type:complete len:99 (+) Transcript_67684:112-408(+)